MSRSVPSSFSDTELSLFYGVELSFDSGTVRLWNGYDDVTIDGDAYIGAGDLLTVSEVEETSEIAARGITIALTGLDTGLISTALSENYQNRTAKVIFGAIESGVFVSYTLFSGRMDVMTINEGADTATIELTAENRLIDLERPRIYRYTSEEQKAIYPDDVGLDYVADLQDKEILWGRV